MRLCSLLVCCWFFLIQTMEAQITAGPDPNSSNNCLITTITLNFNGIVNGRNSYSFSDGMSTFTILWTGSRWEFRLDDLFLLSYNVANTLEPPCSSGSLWAPGPGCDFKTAPYIGGGCSSIVLPIELLHFEAAVQGRSVALQWATAAEYHNLQFFIERCAENELDWATIGEVAGGGNTASEHRYTFLDDAPPAMGLLYYRLVWVDVNGREERSRSIAVHLGDAGTVSLAPNPVREVLKVSLPNDGETASTLRLHNALGCVVLVQPLSGAYTELNVSALAPGAYFVEIFQEGKTDRQWVLLKKE